MHILYSDISQDKLVSDWNDGFLANHTDDEMQSLRGRLDTFNPDFETPHSEDRVLLDYLPGLGSRVTIRDKVKRKHSG